MKITRKQVLMAVRYEPLTAGNWIRESSCQVCAVGATLRRCGIDDAEINNLGYKVYYASEDSIDDGQFGETAMDKKYIRKHLKNKYYLAALSCYWEGVVAPKYGVDPDFASQHFQKVTPEAREELASWVEKNIPVSFTAKELK